MPPVPGGPVEAQPGVRLEEVEVAADGHRDGRGVDDGQRGTGGVRSGSWAGWLSGVPGLDPAGLRGQQGAGRGGAEMAAADRVVHDDEPAAVVEDGLHRDLGDDVRHAGQDVVRTQHRPPGGERLGVAGAVPGRLADGVGDEGDRLGDVEPQPPGAAGAGQLGGA